MSTRWLTIQCIHCDDSIDDVMLDDFDQAEWERRGWTFGLFGQSGNGLIIESPRSASITGVCPDHKLDNPDHDALIVSIL